MLWGRGFVGSHVTRLRTPAVLKERGVFGFMMRTLRRGKGAVFRIRAGGLVENPVVLDSRRVRRTWFAWTFLGPIRVIVLKTASSQQVRDVQMVIVWNWQMHSIQTRVFV